ncbi:Primosomal protein N' [Aquisphaera giovannonii]|uniref:Replication restart protein PriA n=1 Tax=Aquisphaera giovannonii TaxID=406548 RepID=A0A5B9W7B4_9BACT|nr:primosomal protein N' [Aquisphaera giovannonii]QEH36144.1 Primosomal protein N' [Aquisphaera giovannonii]
MFDGDDQAGESAPDERPGAWFGADRVPPRAAAGPYAGIVVNRPIDQVLTYRCGPRVAAAIRPGQRVRVPLGKGNRLAVGYCVGVEDAPPEGLDPGRLKEVAEVLDPAPLIDSRMLELTRWMAEYYVCSWGQALDSAVPAGVRNQAGTRVGTFLLVPEETRQALKDQTLKPRLSPKQAAAMETLCRATGPLTISDVCRRAKCTAAPILALRRQGLIHSVKRRVGLGEAFGADEGDGESDLPDLARPPGPPGGVGPAKARLTLTPEQDAVMAALRPALAGDGFAPFLIHGVTGSGKTEVYLSAIEQVVARGREAIVLVPEISLTPQTIRRFRRRFDRVAVLHSHLSDVERHRHWQSIAEGEVQVVVGARSAIFAPARRLGLIVIDEEHESTFKQETVPRYHARDVAVKRAQLERVPVLLGSATPALETWRNADRGRYVKLAMASRVEGRPMPAVDVIDLRREKKFTGGLSESLREAVHRAVDDGGQVILLLNRRGYHTFVICPHCGDVVKCHACDVAMTHHKGRRLLLCHTCDAERPCPPACPSCGKPGLHYGGIGTERLEKEVIGAFPDRVVRRMDSDTMRRPGSHEEVLAAFKAGDVQILLGTQMIAKGLDFPNVTLVGVVNADTALHLPDFRAAERTFQLVAQVAGRTGRGDKPGRVLVQTYCPDAPAIVHAVRHDYEGFVAVELPEREGHGTPPFHRIVRVIARGPEESVVAKYMERLGVELRGAAEPSVRILGPAPAPILKIRNLYRFHLQARCPTARPLQVLLRDVPGRVPAPGGVELAIDVDPTSML